MKYLSPICALQFIICTFATETYILEVYGTTKRTKKDRNRQP